jgi:hypothetical protein
MIVNVPEANKEAGQKECVHQSLCSLAVSLVVRSTVLKCLLCGLCRTESLFCKYRVSAPVSSHNSVNCYEVWL